MFKTKFSKWHSGKDTAVVVLGAKVILSDYLFHWIYIVCMRRDL